MCYNTDTKWLFLLHVLASLFSAFLFTACQDTVEDETVKPSVRASFVKLNGSDTAVKATVFVEGPDGNALSGAVVIVKDGRNTMTQLAYESASCSYNGTLEEITGGTTYVVEVASVLSDGIIKLNIPYSAPEGPPRVTVFQDSDGNSVLRGQNLSANRQVQIGWADVGEGVVYQVAVKTALKTVYAVLTDACTVTVPSGNFQPGAYLLEITAQKIYGDVFFRTAPYYSASFAASPMVSCYVD
jgi:hypothetical protein